MLPPRILRRLLLAPLLLALTVVMVVTLPPLVLLASAVSPWLPGRWRALRLLWFALVWLVLESAALFACLGLWITSGFGGRLRSERYQDRHYAIMRWFLDVMFQVATGVFRLRVEVKEPDPTPGELAARLKRPVIVMSRHAGPGDSFLLVHRLLVDYQRRPRVVLKAMLQLDPGVDVVMNRLPHAFVNARRGGAGLVAREIGRLARGLGPTGALVIFPEGGNFTPRRRLRAIELLERRKLREQAARARAMRHLMAPHTSGALAAIAAAPGADVIFVAHTGLEDLITVGDVWRNLPMEQVLKARWWRVPAAEVPSGRDEQVRWLYDWWARIDAWIADNRPVPLPRPRAGIGGSP
ncbi:MAG TPA: 1-acyl-sn-glycerol-3-phosphate acyltransferase [Actinomycetota bacterium]|nr:1-acyl-sn-glycerol-3-phosphate acyltransferase [Actinomycetota bacterium]